MKKLIYTFFLFALVLVAPRIEAKSSTTLTNPAPNTAFVVCAEQVNPNITTVLEGILENMGVEVQELKVLDLNNEKSCTIIIDGTIGDMPVQLKITFEGETCSELLRRLMQ